MAWSILLLFLPVVICNSQSWGISSSPNALVPFANPFSLSSPNFSTYLWTNLRCDGLRGLLVRHSAGVEFEAFEGNPSVPVKPRGVCGASWVDVVSPVLLNVTLSALPKHSNWTYVGEFVWHVEQTVGFYAISFGGASSTLLMPDCTASPREITENSKIPVTLEIVVEPSLQTEGKKRVSNCKTVSMSNPSNCIVCQIGYYLQSATHCAACTVCSSGYYKSSACKTDADVDTGCTACSPCGSGYYISSCTSSGAVCSLCSTSCGSGYYISTACTSAADTVCTACDPSCSSCFSGTSTSCLSCSSGYYASATNTCTACSTSCGSGYYISAACTSTANTVCTACSTCGSGNYISAACTSTANTVCTACQTITNCATYSSTCSTGTDTTDRVCTACGM